ncbi:MAG: glycoside hydrolase N-terminal domain-containing protein, partial [Phycisphaerae bacterium]
MPITSVISSSPAERWEDALISGNGATGVMVMGGPLDETIVVNHEKLWVVMVDVRRDVADMREAMAEARQLAREHRFQEAADLIMARFTEANRRTYDPRHLVKGRRLPPDRVHPGLHLRLLIPQEGRPENYRREMVLDTGEVIVRWDDGRGSWRREVFVSRPHDAIILRLRKPEKAKLDCLLWLAEAPGRLPGDFASVAVEHRDDEMCFRGVYGRKAGKAEAEGYHALARIVCRGGRSENVAGQGIRITGADEVLLAMRVEYLEVAGRADVAALRDALADLPRDYDQLLEAHAAVHGEMFRRVRLDLGGDHGRGKTSEEIIERADRAGPTAELLELLHAVGRYALISSSGELPPTLMGIWGNTWTPAWDGRFTFDSNLNLAIAAGSQGDLPEAMESYFGFIERIAGDWGRNARRLYGCRGGVSELTQGYRDGLTMWGSYPWTGGAGWLGSYFYDHWLYTHDAAFLRDRVVPLLRQVALFYEDFLEGTEGDDGRYVFYPSISPENVPSSLPAGGRTDIVPNATSEIAICRQVLTSLIAACRELGIEQDSIPRWEAMLAKLPEYRVNGDGAIAEWSCPGIEDNYNHRHNSHLYGVYPALEIDPVRAPELFRAARVAIRKRMEAGRGDCSAHGLMHMAFFATRLKDPELLWKTLDEFARSRFLNRSLIGSHNPNLRIYNLDA